MWSMNHLALSTQSVPLLKSSIQKLQDHYFRHPAVIPLDVVVCVDSADHAETAIAERSLLIRSAPEVVFAYLSAIHEALDKGDDALLAAWRQTMLACPVLFKCISNKDDQHRVTLQFREDLTQNYATMRYNAVQKMFDVKSSMDGLAARGGRNSAENVAAFYRTVRWSEGGDSITREFIDCSMTVLKRLMALPRCAQIVLGLSEEGIANPLDSIYKLHKIIVRASTPDKLEWSLELLVDFWRSGMLKTDQLSIRHIDGRATGNQGKGVVDLMVFKMELLTHLTGAFLDNRTFKPQDKQLLRDACTSIEKFRRRCGYCFNSSMKKVSLNCQSAHMTSNK